jgi:hypothetical protein
MGIRAPGLKEYVSPETMNCPSVAVPLPRLLSWIVAAGGEQHTASFAG